MHAAVRVLWLAACTAALAGAAGGAAAQAVSFSGSLGDKALLIIDGTPRTVATGATVAGVRLVSMANGSALVEIAGKRHTLTLGGTHTNLGGAPSEGGATQIVLSAGSGGHFVTDGAINGSAVRFMVDTGATYISMGAAEAERLGIDYRKGVRGQSATANGVVVAYRVSLGSVRVGDVQVYNVDAVVHQMPMPVVLLGNSFLTRFQMKRENDTMTLSKRY